MNRYEYRFIAACPTNNDPIAYDLTIESSVMIKVEDIKAVCTVDEPIFHEPLADTLQHHLGGRHTLTAVHHDVRITTTRN